VIVPVIELGEALVAVNEGIFPVPLAPRPIAVLELIHANVVPGSVEVKAATVTVLP
jgi:hypothetical protein